LSNVKLKVPGTDIVGPLPADLQSPDLCTCSVLQRQPETTFGNVKADATRRQRPLLPTGEFLPGDPSLCLARLSIIRHSLASVPKEPVISTNEALHQRHRRGGSRSARPRAAGHLAGRDDGAFQPRSDPLTTRKPAATLVQTDQNGGR
jgi:hypothetical protein